MKEGWVHTILDECCDINYGTRVVRAQVSGNEYPVYGGGGETFRIDKYNREDCLVVSRFAMSPQCTRFVEGKFFLNDSGLTVSTKQNSKLSQGLLDIYLLANNNTIYSLGRGSAQRNLDVKAFRKLPISYPVSLDEQKAIVAKINAEFAKIDQIKHNAETALKDALLLFDSALNELFISQDDWRMIKLGDVCSIASSLVDPTLPQYANMPHIGGANIVSTTGEFIDVKTVAEESLESGKYLFDNSVVLYNKIRPYLKKISIPNFSGLCSADMYPLTPNELITRDFLKYLLLTKKFTEYAIAGSARAGMPKVNRKHLFGYECGIPDIEEQKRICIKLQKLLEKAKNLRCNCELIEKESDQLKLAILKQNFE